MSMLLTTVAIACLGNYIFRAVIVVRILIILLTKTLNYISAKPYGTFVLFSALSVREIGTAHFGFEGRNKEHQGPRLSISTLTGPWVK